MATKVWSGHVTFGLISIPTYMNTCARDSKAIALQTFHKTDGGKMRRPDMCELCEERVPRGEIVKGYAVDKGFIPITPEELEAITPESNKTIEITETVKWADVDPIYLAESFYILPEDPGRKAYSLLVSALKQSGRVAIGQVCKSNREHIILLRPKGSGLVAHFLWYANEVNGVAEFDNLKLEKLSAQEEKLALKLVENLAADFLPEDFENGYEMRLTQLVASKLDKTGATKSPSPVEGRKHEPSRDLAEMLTASLRAPKKQRKVA